MTDYSKPPGHMQDGARRYVENGIKPGAFLMAVLSNNLLNAFQLAEDIAAMRICVGWLFIEAPFGCFGSPIKVADWIAKGGEHGKSEAVAT